MSIIINVMVSYYFFTKGADTLVLSPLNSIVKVINTILKRPLDPNINSWYLSDTYKDRIFTDVEKEYSNVVACICRISLHLSTTFGNQNVQYVANEYVFKNEISKVNQQVATRLCAYFAFFEICDMEQYFPPDRPEYALYVNRIVEIVERTTDRYLGNAYFDSMKNRFFLVWELKKSSIKENFHKVNRNSAESGTLSIICISKIVIKLRQFFDEIRNLNPEYFIEKYRFNNKFKRRNSNVRPEY